MIEVTQFHFSKADFAGMPPKERTLIFLAGQTVNQVNIWLKLIRLSSSFESASEVENKLSADQSHVLLRALFGTLHEAWVWQTRRDMRPLIASYLPKLSVDSQTARRALSKHLGNGGTMDALRNGYSFHSPTTTMLDEAFAAMPDDENWSWYVTDEHSSTLMLSCETVLGYGVAGEGRGVNLNDGFGNILSEVIGVANAMNKFITELLAVALGSNLPTTPRQSAIMIEHAPQLKDAVLPFYIEGIRLNEAFTVG